MYIINAPRIIHETIDKETVAIDTESGVYFSITGSGYLIVQMLDQGADVESLIARLAAVFDMDPSALRPVVDAFVAQLLAEALIVPATVGADDTAQSEPRRPDSEPFTLPTLHKFTDMHDLLLMDPIHNVSEAGWPHRA
jgi:hypothetical protein